MTEKQQARLKKADPKQNLVLHRRKLLEKETRQAIQARRTAERSGILRSSKSTNQQIRESSSMSQVQLDESSDPE